MSADNWAICPRCRSRAVDAAESEREAVMALYGTIPVDEFEAKRDALTDVDPEEFRTFREDYEFYGAEDGEVQAHYSGACAACGLRPARGVQARRAVLVLRRSRPGRAGRLF